MQRCVSANGSILRWLTTANVARDLDRLRAAVGDPKLNFYGASYGGLIGETYTTLFPGRTGAMVIDSPTDGEAWIKQPLEGVREQEASFERSLDRFIHWCSVRFAGCALGADDPSGDFDALVERLNETPAPVSEGDPVSGDDVLVAAEESLYTRFAWSPLAAALASVAAGDGDGIRALAGDGAGSVGSAYPAYMMNEGRYPRRFEPFLRANEHAYGLSPHFWWVRGYEWAGVSLYPLSPRGVYRGPFTHAPGARSVLVIGGTHDPAAPYIWARRYDRRPRQRPAPDLRERRPRGRHRPQPLHHRKRPRLPRGRVLPPAGARCKQDVPDAAAALRVTRDDARREEWKAMVR